MLLAACVGKEPAEPEAPVQAIALASTVDDQFAIVGGAVTASANDGNVPANTVDGSLTTRWSASGDGQWIRFDLGSVSRVAFVKIAFYNGASRIALIDVETSVDGTTWTTALEGVSSSLTTALQTFDFADVEQARFVRIVGHGNSTNAWNSFTEVGVFGGAPSAAFFCTHGTTRCAPTGRQVCNFGIWTNMPCAAGTVCTGEGTCNFQPCQLGTAICNGTHRLACSSQGFFVSEPCAINSICIGDGQCSDCIEGEAHCSGTNRMVCELGIFRVRNCAFNSVCIGQGQCSECTGNEAFCEANGDRKVCQNGLLVPMNCAQGLVCTGAGDCTVSTSCTHGAARCNASGSREVCNFGNWISMVCAAGTVCSGAGDCTVAPPPPPPSPSIANLTVNDTSNGNDGVANNTQWHIQPTFLGAGQVAFGDRTFTIGTLPPAAAHLSGLPWIRTAADSKTYDGTLPLATADITGSFVYLAMDNRHGTGFLAGYTIEPYTLPVSENGVARTYEVWKKAVTTSGSTFTFPKIGVTTAPCYFVIVQ